MYSILNVDPVMKNNTLIQPTKSKKPQQYPTWFAHA